ncbi:ABC transporter substrate binding protein [Pseudodesulfovibrio sp. zrk46]|uniref:ABC transporter substrate-binding protein n=1 Tax=Pseudodesulfovibrio sp. zrk46 TaxID=2725288 RepID=UPI0014493433|nr:ABC transporter substrate binding protein [Pseudodesulfovibrio sp. zrk46]QJB54911.1 hypothetical protein HFN16_00175 [Pseudodesulfovibrio sp. zrk46]
MDKLIVFIMCLVFLTGAQTQSWASQRTVLIVYSYNEELAWTQQCDRGIRQALSNDVTIERLYMDTKRLPQHEFADRAKAIMKGFHRLQPDLVMLSDDNALRLLGPEIAASGTPVVYFGINGNPRDYFIDLPANVVGIIERIPVFHWARVIFEIVPDADSLVVLMDDSPTADAIIKSAFNRRTKVQLGEKEVDLLKVRYFEDWKRFIQETEHGAILMPVYHTLKDAAGTHIPFEKVIKWTSANSRVPVFASQDYAVGDEGVVGSHTVLGEEHGRLAGIMAKKILEGVSALQLSVADDQSGAYYFNRNQLERFGLVLPESMKGLEIIMN